MVDLIRPSRLRVVLRSRDDRGSGSLELVVIFPVILLLIFGVIQGACFFYARSVALAAAQEGLRDARVETGTAAAGADAAQAFLARLDDGMLTEVRISPSRGGGSASVTVSGRALSVLPGTPGLPISQTAAGPIEVFTTGQP